MATETLAATGIGTYDEWELVTGSTKISAVATPDDDNTSAIRTSVNNLIQSFTVTPSALNVGDTITKVEIVGRYAGTHSSTDASLRVGYSFNVSGGGTQSGETSTFTIARSDLPFTWYTRTDAFSGLSVVYGGNLEFYVKKMTFHGARVTTFYTIVTYTPAATAKPALYYAMMNC